MTPHEIIEESVSIPSSTGVLEGVLSYPEEVPPERAVLLLSPHPHMGGRMDNNVIEHLARRLSEDGCASLRFNYAGVGQSALAFPEGLSSFEYWSRLEEARDYRAVLPGALAARQFLLNSLPPCTPLHYVGYSFGSCIAILLAGEYPPTKLSAISPPVSRVDMEGLDALDLPVCFVTGNKDFVYDAKRFRNVRGAVPGPTTHVELEGCDHFFRKVEERVYQAIRPFMFESQERVDAW